MSENLNLSTESTVLNELTTEVRKTNREPLVAESFSFPNSFAI